MQGRCSGRAATGARRAAKPPACGTNGGNRGQALQRPPYSLLSTVVGGGNRRVRRQLNKWRLNQHIKWARQQGLSREWSGR